ncbi:unnamed protein product [Ilex paraguariensis]|uniref:Growth-regulating factor n=1 Tax=Ilex paraguariensis TaxID=185542 RepID=A0ABC8TW63_9AQUA
METQRPPSKIARFAQHGPMKRNGSIGGEGSHPTGLGLGLELGHGLGCYGFTVLQLQELEHQALIFKYMEAGLPVPHHLIFPIWKSFARSLNALNKEVYQHCANFLGCGTVYSDYYTNSMDPEPGRCRRTDGKKWRCGNSVVPDQKYCERHMHRGRQRSGKQREEASQLSTRTSHDTTETGLSISLPTAK